MQEIQNPAAVNIHESPPLCVPNMLPNEAAVCPWLFSWAKASLQNLFLSVIQDINIAEISVSICLLANIKERWLLCVCILLIVYNLNFSSLLFLLISRKTIKIYIDVCQIDFLEESRKVWIMGSEVWIISRSNNPKDWGVFSHLQIFAIPIFLNKLCVPSRYIFCLFHITEVSTMGLEEVIYLF